MVCNKHTTVCLPTGAVDMTVSNQWSWHHMLILSPLASHIRWQERRCELLVLILMVNVLIPWTSKWVSSLLPVAKSTASVCGCYNEKDKHLDIFCGHFIAHTFFFCPVYVNNVLHKFKCKQNATSSYYLIHKFMGSLRFPIFMDNLEKAGYVWNCTKISVHTKVFTCFLEYKILL